MNMKSLFIILVLSFLAARSETKNILGIFVTYSRSHQIVFMSVVKGLAERGHNITVITTLPLMDPNQNFRHIQLSNGLPSDDLSGLTNKPKYPLLQLGTEVLLLKNLISSMSSVLKDSVLVNFLEEDNHFDLLLTGYGFNEFLLGIAARYNCPSTLIWVMRPITHLSLMMGNPLGTSYVPMAIFTDSQEMTFIGRVWNLVITGIERIAFAALDWYIKSIYE